MLATIVDTGALLKTVAASLIAGVGVTMIFSIAILGASRFADMNRDGRSAAAVAFGLLGLAALVVAGAAVVLGIIVMTRK